MKTFSIPILPLVLGFGKRPKEQSDHFMIDIQVVIFGVRIDILLEQE